MGFLVEKRVWVIQRRKGSQNDNPRRSKDLEVRRLGKSKGRWEVKLDHCGSERAGKREELLNLSTQIKKLVRDKKVQQSKNI